MKVINGREKQQSTRSEAAPPPVLPEVELLADVLERLLAYTVSHTSHDGEGDDMYNECIPKLIRVRNK